MFHRHGSDKVVVINGSASGNDTYEFNLWKPWSVPLFMPCLWSWRLLGQSDHGGTVVETGQGSLF